MKIKYGNIDINIEIFPPTINKFIKWYNEFLYIEGIENYKIYIGGAFLEGWFTWDIDIILTSKTLYPRELKRIMTDGIKLGYEKYNMFVDIQYAPNYTPMLIGTKEIAKRILIGNSFIKNNKINYLKNCKQISNGLWYKETKCPKKKQKFRIENGKKYTKMPLCIR